MIKEKQVNFTCQKCNNRGVSLVSHHIESWHSNVELRLDISNGICLCKNVIINSINFMGKRITIEFN